MRILKFIKNYKYIFSYSQTSKLEIFLNIIQLLFYKLINKRFVVKEIYKNKMILNLDTPGISKTLFLYGKREILDTDIIINEIKNNMNVLDIGANIGFYVLLESSLLGDGKVYAFEPDPRNIKILERNIRLNNFSDKVKLYPYAIAEKNCIKKFNLYRETNLNSFIKRKEQGTSIDVKCIKLDDFSEIDKIAFIRMDIEGYECLAIDGMIDFLTRKESLKLQIEVHPRYYDNKEFDFNRRLKLLENFGFYVKYLVSAGVAEPEQIINLGYKPIKTAREGKLTHGLYENVKIDDLMNFLKSDIKIVRSILLEKK